jgi:hypothetical protein
MNAWFSSGRLCSYSSKKLEKIHGKAAAALGQEVDKK